MNIPRERAHTLNVHVGLVVLANYFPALRKKLRRTGGTSSARYCYAVWLRHLVMAHAHGCSTTPNAIVELGPGDSLGIGLAGLLSGANVYHAFDVMPYADSATNLAVFDELVALFQQRADIPHDGDVASVQPDLDDYAFPAHILTDERLGSCLHPERIAAIRDALAHVNTHTQESIYISYVVPWDETHSLPTDSVDFVLSQAVMEYPPNLTRVYQDMHNWLKPTGLISHQIDFKSHGSASVWNGHWTYSNIVWKLMRGHLNRASHSMHIDALRKLNFEIVCDLTKKQASGVSRKQLAPRFRGLSDDDLTTSGAFIQAVKRV